MKTNSYELNTAELNAVSGGLKWSPTSNPDVIDARGGQINFLWWRFSFDIRGNLSNIRWV